jgi:hypothetical protein
MDILPSITQTKTGSELFDLLSAPLPASSRKVDSYAVIDPLTHELFLLKRLFCFQGEREVRAIREISQGMGDLYSMHCWFLTTNQPNPRKWPLAFRIEKQHGVSIYTGESQVSTADQEVYRKALERIKQILQPEKPDATAWAALAEQAVLAHRIQDEKHFGPGVRVLDDPAKLTFTLDHVDAPGKPAINLQITMAGMVWEADLKSHNIKISYQNRTQTRPADERDLEMLAGAAYDLIQWGQKLVS